MPPVISGLLTFELRPHEQHELTVESIGITGHCMTRAIVRHPPCRAYPRNLNCASKEFILAIYLWGQKQVFHATEAEAMNEPHGTLITFRGAL